MLVTEFHKVCCMEQFHAFTLCFPLGNDQKTLQTLVNSMQTILTYTNYINSLTQTKATACQTYVFWT